MNKIKIANKMLYKFNSSAEFYERYKGRELLSYGAYNFNKRFDNELFNVAGDGIYALIGCSVAYFHDWEYLLENGLSDEVARALHTQNNLSVEYYERELTYFKDKARIQIKAFSEFMGVYND